MIGEDSRLRASWDVCATGLILASCPADSWAAIQEIESAMPGTQYLRSLYWAVVTTTTVGYGDITPNRNVE